MAVAGYNIYLGGVKQNTTLVTNLSYALSGLTASTAYSVTVSAVDGSGNESAQTAATNFSTTAAADTTAPTISSATIENAAPSNLVVVFSEAVTIGALTGLSITGTSAPTISSVTGSGTSTLTFVLSAAAVNGNVWTLDVLGTNTIKDTAATPNALAATTQAITNNVAAADTTAPTYITGFPATANVLSTSFDTNVQLNEIGRAYMVVVADAAAAPTSAQVKAGLNSAGAAALKAGNVIVAAASTTYTIPTTGLTASTAYDVYVVAEDDEATPNLQATPVKLDVTTAAAASSLTTVSSYPQTETTGDMIDVVAAANGTVSGVTRDGIKYAFDGVNPLISVPYNLVHSLVDGSGDIPFEIEMKLLFNDLTATQFIITKRSLSTIGDYVFSISSSGLSVSLYQNGDPSISIGRRISTDQLVTGQEYLVKYKYDGSKARTGISIELDGVRKDNVDSGNATYTGMTSSTIDLYIGSVDPGFNSGLKFNGTMRDLKFKK